MDFISLLVAAGAYGGAVVVKRIVDTPIELAFDHIMSKIGASLRREPEPKDLDSLAIKNAGLKEDSTLIGEVDQIFTRSSALRRARLVESVLEGARLLWVDDNPENNLYEQQVLRAFGVLIETALTTKEAMYKVKYSHYDLIISDMSRQGQGDAGLELLNRLRESDKHPPMIYYVGNVDPSRPTPSGAFGIADFPESLFHYVLDVIERNRT